MWIALKVAQSQEVVPTWLASFHMGDLFFKISFLLRGLTLTGGGTDTNGDAGDH